MLYSAQNRSARVTTVHANMVSFLSAPVANVDVMMDKSFLIFSKEAIWFSSDDEVDVAPSSRLETISGVVDDVDAAAAAAASSSL
ncbi:ORF393 [White spot syndrome virus]|uniref:Wsv356 n=3 Tax=White spot syndrome virus TaxID=342409 RepID=Q8VAP5_WSSVS|nr:wsv356 [Shrimp white spot syndrome virus]ATU83787.1 ORF393 [White spot syndrome virus]AAL33358.1 wsv356 [Shrimp white spot syndrome virus]AAL89283.1 WSSV415 [Shrimp white spot syndrome virus]AWQ60483.1 wsv356 [Shrimp white spot syndrome virus]AWQ60928.1 wsv356 [Shrimp white spot syndrome virus]